MNMSLCDPLANSAAGIILNSICRIENVELVNMNDCMASGQLVTAPSQQDPTAAPTEVEEVDDTLLKTMSD